MVIACGLEGSKCLFGSGPYGRRSGLDYAGHEEWLARVVKFLSKAFKTFWRKTE